MVTDKVMQALAAALAPHLKDVQFKAPSGTPSTPYYTGPGGLFGVSGLERDVISTRVQPRGLASVLPAFGSQDMYPLYAYITGFQDASGSEKDGVCDDAPTAGAAKSCLQTATFGRYERMTREMEINRVGQRINRGEFLDLRLLNDPLVDQMGGIMAQQFSLGQQSARMLGAEMLMRFLEVGVAFQNLICPQIYTGNPANNSTSGGYKEFPGLDILISDSKVDALTGDSCPSLASDVKDFNYGRVDNSNLDPDIVNVLTYMMRYLKHNAAQMNFGATTWRFAMREDLFYELTAIWPCSYLTYRCIFRDSNPSLSVDANDAIRMRDAMRQGRYLVIDGERYPVVIDDCIPEESNADTANLEQGEFASDIYVIPMTVRGGTPVTFMQYFDYRYGTMPAVQQGRYGSYYWTDSGRYLWHAKPPVNWCIQHQAKIEPRLILLTPHLAGRVTNVAYAPLQHTRDPLPSQTYFVDGGVTDGREAPSLYSDWNQPS